MTPKASGASRPLVVEFAGLPGAGKTTTSRRVAELLGERGYRCAYRPPLVAHRRAAAGHRFRFLLFRATRFRLLVAGIRYALAVRPLRISRIRDLTHVFFLAYYQRVQRRSAYDVVLMDQSVVQTMWTATVPGRAVDPGAADRLLDAYYRAALGPADLVVFRVDPAAAAARVAARPKGPWRARFDHLPSDVVRNVLAAQVADLHDIARRAALTTGLVPLHVDGARPLHENALRIAAFVENALAVRARSTAAAVHRDDAHAAPPGAADPSLPRDPAR